MLVRDSQKLRTKVQSFQIHSSSSKTPNLTNYNWDVSISCQSPALRHLSLRDADHKQVFFQENNGYREGLDTLELSQTSCILNI